jgi:hypothetical protein
MDYVISFEKRCEKYKYAIEKYPDVLLHEFQTAVNICNLQSSDTILNIPAACIPLEKYFQVQPIKYIEYDINPIFSKLMNIHTCTLDKIPLKNNEVDIIISLSGLHHTNIGERENFYKECMRILKDQNSKLIIGDVLKGSKEDIWLNTFVNKYNSSGHNGIFWNESDKLLLKKNGFQTTIRIEKYPWIFDSENSMVDFCKNLFGLDLATNEIIIEGINSYLQPYKKNNMVYIDWCLIYFISTKNQASFHLLNNI